MNLQGKIEVYMAINAITQVWNRIKSINIQYFLNLIKYLIIFNDLQLLSNVIRKKFAYFKLFENLYISFI